ncbi:hypothetical protein CcI49_35060 [Frankia sp. CcI49]|uniref:hypothetical protein n=1 Tax=Frankia sp. CcI49 TaxID=1745382 RepID=UPI0009775805|nr:hypothetical protein [Frankia sp. CcI49]ONH51753.1 hypothetical protein CcI49_35060 [Frankia sp. CcI49]
MDLAPAIDDDGRLGCCTRGEYAGCHVLVTTETEHSFYAYISDQPDLPRDEARFDDFAVHEDDLENVMAELGVVWIPREDDDELERQIFDLRRGWCRWRRRRQRLHTIARIFGRIPRKGDGGTT